MRSRKAKPKPPAKPDPVLFNRYFDLIRRIGALIPNHPEILDWGYRSEELLRMPDFKSDDLIEIPGIEKQVERCWRIVIEVWHEKHPK